MATISNVENLYVGMASNIQNASSKLNKFLKVLTDGATKIDKFSKKMKELSTDFSDLSNDVRNFTTKFTSVLSKVSKGSTIFNTLSKSIEKVNQKADKGTTIFNGLTKSMEKANQKAGKGATTFNGLNKSIDKTYSKVGKTITRLKNLGNTAGSSMKKLKKAADMADKANNGTKKQKDASEPGDKKKGSGIGKLFSSMFSKDKLKSGMEMVDQYTNTVKGKNGLKSDKNMQKLYNASIRSRTPVKDMSLAVTNMGSLDTFQSKTDLINFTEITQKALKSGGSKQNIVDVSESMSDGNLNGDEFSSLMNNPVVSNAMTSYTGKSSKELSQMAEQGTITADLFKNAMFASSEQINTEFAKQPMTFADSYTMIQNAGIKAFSSIAKAISDVLGSDLFQSFINGIINGFTVIGSIISWVVGIVGNIAEFFVNNWSMIAPVIMGIVTALSLYAGLLVITSTLEAIGQGIKIVSTIAAYAFAFATGAETGATLAATEAQNGLNAALLASPITWIIIILIALIAIIYFIIAAINKVTGSSISATGVIMGALATAGAFIYNLFLSVFQFILGIVNALINPFINIANFLGNIFTNPISSIIYLFQGMADSVLAVLQNIASGMDMVFGTHMGDTVAGWRTDVKKMADTAVKKYAPDENYKKVIDNVDYGVDDFGLKRLNYKNTAKLGYNTGKGIDNKASGLYDKFTGNGLKDPTKSLIGKDYKKDLNKYSKKDFTKSLTGEGIKSNGNDLGTKNKPMTVDGKGSNGSVGVQMDNEDLSYLRDLAERDYIANIATNTMAPNISVSFGDVHENADADQIYGRIKSILKEEIAIAAEGVY